MHLTEISKTSQKHTAYMRKTKNHQQNSFLLKYYEICLKSDTKTCTIQKSVRNLFRVTNFDRKKSKFLFLNGKVISATKQ